MTAQPHPLVAETERERLIQAQAYGNGWRAAMDGASHSASSHRIEQVIKELEKLANEEERLKKESKTNEPWMGHAYANSAYLKAIALLREGAK